MASTSVGKIGVKIFASAEGMRRGISDAVSQLDRLEKATTDIKKSTRNLFALQGIQAAGKAFATIASAATRVASSMKQQVLSANNLYESYAKLGRRVGATGQEIAGLVYAADRSGVSFEQMTLALSTLERRFGDAAAGSATYVNAFAQIGLSLEDLAGKTSVERFELVAESISQMASPAQQLAVAGKLFEEAGVKLVPLFQNGAKGLTAMTKRAERLGITLEGVDFTAFERMKDALDDVYAIVVSIGARVAEKITPSIQAMVERIANVLTPANAEAFASTVAEYFSEAARVLLDAADYVIATVTPAIERISKSQEKSSSAFGDFAGFILNTVDGIRIVVKGATGIIQGLLGGFLKAITFPIRMMTELYAKLTGSQGGIVDWAGAVADGFSDGLLKGAGESFTSAGRVISNAADRLDASNRAAANSISQGIKRPDVTIDVDRKGLEQDRVARKALQASALKQQTQLAKSIERATARSAFYDYNTSAGRNEFHSLQRGDEFAKLAREQLEQQKKMVDLLSQPEPTVQLGY